MKKHYKTIKFAFASALLGLVLAGFTSCGKKDENSPGVEFMPDMYRSPSLEYYGTHTVDGVEENVAKDPVKGTVARGFLPYAYANTPEGFEQATLNLKNPLPVSSREQFEKEGEIIYGKFCLHCHGATGAGDGKVAGKLPGPPPPYANIQGLTEGRMFHSISYGKGMMGPHNSLLTQEERWKVVYFIQKLIGPKNAAPAADSTANAGAKPSVDSTKTDSAKPEVKK